MSGAAAYASSWSAEQQRYCCYKHQIGCHTKVQQALFLDAFVTCWVVQVIVRPHYHTITKTKAVQVPVPVPVPAPPAQVITHVQNVPIHASWRCSPFLTAQDAPQIIKVPTPGPPNVAAWLGLDQSRSLRCPSTSTRSTSCPCQSQARLSTTLCQCP